MNAIIREGMDIVRNALRLGKGKCMIFLFFWKIWVWKDHQNDIKNELRFWKISKTSVTNRGTCAAAIPQKRYTIVF